MWGGTTMLARRQRRSSSDRDERCLSSRPAAPRLGASARTRNYNIIYINNIDLEPSDMEHVSELSKSIIAKCGGLPKVIDVVAYHYNLSYKQAYSKLKDINDNFMHILEGFHSIRGLFSWMQSYLETCKDDLKPCIFYLPVFPIGHSIRLKHLLWRLRAEGYIRNTSSHTVNKNMEMLLSELWEFSMFQLHASSKPVKIQVNGFLHEYINSRPMEDNLVFALEGPCSRQLQRARGQHLTTRDNWERDINVFRSTDFSRLRSLTVFGECMQFMFDPAKIKMRYVRVLDLEDASGVTNGDIKNIVQVFPRLKFLSLRGCRYITHLPKSLGSLRHLQTLDVRDTSIAMLPKAILKLQKLQYVRAGTIHSAPWDEGRIMVQYQAETREEIISTSITAEDGTIFAAASSPPAEDGAASFAVAPLAPAEDAAATVATAPSDPAEDSAAEVAATPLDPEEEGTAFVPAPSTPAEDSTRTVVAAPSTQAEDAGATVEAAPSAPAEDATTVAATPSSAATEDATTITRAPLSPATPWAQTEDGTTVTAAPSALAEGATTVAAAATAQAKDRTTVATSALLAPVQNAITISPEQADDCSEAAAAQSSMPHALLPSCLSNLCSRRSRHDNTHHGVEVPAGIGKLWALQTLGIVNFGPGNKAVIGKEFHELTQLARLGVCGVNRDNIHDFFSAISGLKHLRRLSVRFDKTMDGLFACLDHTVASPPETLDQGLKLHGHVRILPSCIWIKKFANASKLDLEVTLQEQQDMRASSIN